jgi:hypothetical protein
MHSVAHSQAIHLEKTMQENVDMGLTFEQEQFAQKSTKELKSLFARADQASESSEDGDTEDDTESSTWIRRMDGMRL